MEDRERDEEGKFSSDHDVALDDIYQLMEPLEPYTSREIADEAEIPRRTAYKFLDELSDAGRIRKKKPEPRRVIWIRPNGE
mgnify:FL=1